MNPEAKIETAACKLLRKLGYITPKLTGETGIPDRMCIGPNGKIFFVEFKYGRNVPSKPQEKYHAKLRNLGFAVIVAYSVNDVIAYLDCAKH